MFPSGVALGLMSSYLAKNMYQKDYFGVILGALTAGALTALYAYATSQESFRFMVAGFSLGFLIGVIGFVLLNAQDIARILSGQPPQESQSDESATVSGAEVG